MEEKSLLKGVDGEAVAADMEEARPYPMRLQYVAQACGCCLLRLCGGAAIADPAPAPAPAPAKDDRISADLGVKTSREGCSSAVCCCRLAKETLVQRLPVTRQEKGEEATADHTTSQPQVKVAVNIEGVTPSKLGLGLPQVVYQLMIVKV